MDNPKLAVVFIVSGTYNRLLDALRTIFEKTKLPFRVYIVVNTDLGANDPPLNELSVYKNVELIFNEQKLGFAANHNKVMARSTEPFIALMNDDVLFENEAFDILVNYLEQHPEVGLVGAQLFNPDGSRQVSVYSDPSLIRIIYKISGLAILTRQDSVLRKWLLRLRLAQLTGIQSLMTYTSPQEVDVIKGVDMIIRREVFEQVGGLDETSLLYGEEVDWHLRIRQAGWKVVLVPSAKITHYGQGQVKLRLQGVFLIEDRKSILHYFQKHRSPWQSNLIRAMIIFFHGGWALFWMPFSREKSGIHFELVKIGWHGKW